MNNGLDGKSFEGATLPSSGPGTKYKHYSDCKHNKLFFVMYTFQLQLIETFFGRVCNKSKMVTAALLHVTVCTTRPGSIAVAAATLPLAVRLTLAAYVSFQKHSNFAQNHPQFWGA